MKDYKERNPSPQNDRRGCLCKDGKTYSRKCCDGSFQAQGIGDIGSHEPTPYQGYRIAGCSDAHEHNVHFHGTLTVGSVYYIVLENGHAGCHTVPEERGSEGIHINTATLYNDCSACTAAN